jgi:precorrin-6B C5,15-methyltransferase / cobalt-precorrin-6B C5,C15-methyltransferase
LSIVGIGEDGVEGLNAAARGLIESAERVFGGTRHLALAKPLIRGTAHPWASPFDSTFAELLSYRGRPVCMLASGDPFQHGAGSTLAGFVAPDETIAIPAPSAYTLAAARLLWPLAQTTLLSFCGRSVDYLRPQLHPGTRILALSSNQNSPGEVGRLLAELGFGSSNLTVLEALGGPRERIRSVGAGTFDLTDIAPLNIVAIEVRAAPGARILARAPGLPDALFDHDGQITKREIRALTLSALAPRRNEHLWDIGAGSGSVAIEWLLADTSLTASALERRPDRVARIQGNAASFGVGNLEVVAGSAPEALAKLRQPDAVFVGGGATTPGLIELVQGRLRPGGRLVVNAVSLESEAVVLGHQKRSGGSLTRIAISHASPIGGENGRMSGWRPAMPILQWLWEKP